jgi:hypothetical protein
MSDKNEIVTAEYKILDKPGEGFQSRNVIYTVAQRLRSHTAGKIIGGYETNKDGQLVPLKNAYAPGDLAPKDALYAVEYALTRGLNPYGHIHLWYQRSNKSPLPQLIIDIDWKILKGWAEWRNPFRTEYVKMNADERQKYGLKEGDLGAVAYNMLDADIKYYHQYQLEFIKSGIKPSEAKLLATQATAKSTGIGVVLASEMRTAQGKLVPPPKGRTWQWRAETRAFRDATRRSHGEPPPAQIKSYAQAQGVAIEDQHVGMLASESFPADIDTESQGRYLAAGEQADSILNGEVVEDRALASDLMRDNGDDDDPLGPVEDEDSPQTTGDYNSFWDYIYGMGLGRDEADKFIAQGNGDFDKALVLLKASQE